MNKPLLAAVLALAVSVPALAQKSKPAAKNADVKLKLVLKLENDKAQGQFTCSGGELKDGAVTYAICNEDKERIKKVFLTQVIQAS